MSNMVEEINVLLGEISLAEYKFYKAKEDYYHKKKMMFINTDWGKLNEERELEGLDKLSSEKKREYYIDTQLQNEHEYYKSCELHYLTLKRYLGLKMEQYIKE